MSLSIRASLITVPGRVLQNPTVKYGQKIVTPSFGSWNLRDVKFSSFSNEIASWSYINAAPRVPAQVITAAVNALAMTAKNQGVQLSRLERGYSVNFIEELEGAFQKLRQNQPRIKIILVVLADDDSSFYNHVKYLGDIKYGIHTVCTIANKLTKKRGDNFDVQYFANVALKFNLKLGGSNHNLEPSKLGIIAQGKTMLVGIDVTHPSPGSSSKAPSVAGMVSSVDSALGQWPAITRIQEEAKDEMVDHLDAMLQTRLRLWQKFNRNTLPENILIYRDGVSEGQYGLVLENELPLLRKACETIYPATAKKAGNPKMTIVIVGKRHNTRFYPTRVDDADRSSNPKNGTVVDRGVTESRNWDFFLQAHTALQGTARPAHYYVVLDEIFSTRKPKPPFVNSADELEDLTHNLCYLFGRATKAVSICPPAYYADLVCERARRYLYEYFDPSPGPTRAISQASGYAGSDELSDASTSDITVHPNLENAMFYI